MSQDSASLEKEVACLRQSYYRKYQEIAQTDLGSQNPYETVVAVMGDLTDLVDSTLNNALKLAVKNLGIKNAEFAVIAMGKTGAREINYLSDVDLIFIADDELVNSGKAQKVAILLIKICNDLISNEPPLWEIDTALRPDGKDGPLVRTVSSSKSYYEKWASNWEFQALMKARFVCGSQKLGDEYQKMINNFIWQASAKPNFIQDCQNMRQRVIDNIPKDLRSREIKLGEGGLRDVEFSVQLLQLAHGKTDEKLRVRSTLEAIQTLGEYGYISRNDARNIEQAYKFLRIIEHRLQYWQNKRTHLFPDINSRDGEELIVKLAKTFSLTIDEFINTYQKTRSEVRQLHLKLYYRPILSAVTSFSKDELSFGKRESDDKLEILGFDDIDATKMHILSLITGTTNTSREGSILTRKQLILEQIMPAILMWISRGEYRQYGLLTFRKISDKLGEVPWFMSKLRDSPVSLEKLCLLLSHSRLICDMIYDYPIVISELEKLEPPSKQAFDKLLRASMKRNGDKPVENQIELLKKIYTQQFLRLAIMYILKELNFQEIAKILSDYIDVLLIMALEVIVKTYKELKSTDICLIGMGRYGGRELSFASDIDLVAVCDDDVDIKMCVDVIIKLKKYLGMDLDFELRPEGKLGSLVKSYTAYQRYFNTQAELWEYHALIRGRIIGSGQLAEDLNNLIDEYRYQFDGLTDKQMSEIRRIKARVETERKRSNLSIDYKLVNGGIADVEWLVQIKQLALAKEHTQLRTTSTIDALNCLFEMGELSEIEYQTLKDAWVYSNKYRNFETLDFKAESFGENEKDEYKKLLRKSRQIFEEWFYGDSSN